MFSFSIPYWYSIVAVVFVRFYLWLIFFLFFLVMMNAYITKDKTYSKKLLDRGMKDKYWGLKFYFLVIKTLGINKPCFFDTLYFHSMQPSLAFKFSSENTNSTVQWLRYSRPNLKFQLLKLPVTFTNIIKCATNSLFTFSNFVLCSQEKFQLGYHRQMQLCKKIDFLAVVPVVPNSNFKRSYVTSLIF